MAALHGKVALVTGASSGLGAETARLFSRQGATVFGIGRDTGRLEGNHGCAHTRGYTTYL